MYMDEQLNAPLLAFPITNQQLSVEVCFPTSSSVYSFLISSDAVMVKTIAIETAKCENLKKKTKNALSYDGDTYARCPSTRRSYR
jgi:hypothetical protein